VYREALRVLRVSRGGAARRRRGSTGAQRRTAHLSDGGDGCEFTTVPRLGRIVDERFGGFESVLAGERARVF
jgi:hypothetical protein